MQVALFSYYLVIFVLGSCVGSFINLAAYRIPKMLHAIWWLESYDYLQLTPKLTNPELRLTLATPGSHCPSCKQLIRWIYKIPIISYIWLGGKCAVCKAKIPVSYLLIEIIAAVSSGLVAVKFGLSYMTIIGLLLTWILLLQAAVDLKACIIPDQVTLPVLWLGLILNNFNVFVDLRSAVFGAIFGYLSFWSIYWIFKLITGKEGMGYGDFKFLAMLGAWFGYQKLLIIVLIASTLGSIVGLWLIITRSKKYGKSSPLPFGPYLAFAGWLIMLYGKQINNLII